MSAVRAARNLHASPRSAFELHPEDHLAAEREAQALGLGVVGVWHSHPRGTPLPSWLDLARAWDGWVHLILGLGGLSPEIRAWRLTGCGFSELPVVTGWPGTSAPGPAASVP